MSTSAVVGGRRDDAPDRRRAHAHAAVTRDGSDRAANVRPSRRLHLEGPSDEGPLHARPSSDTVASSTIPGAQDVAIRFIDAPKEGFDGWSLHGARRSPRTDASTTRRAAPSRCCASTRRPRSRAARSGPRSRVSTTCTSTVTAACEPTMASLRWHPEPSASRAQDRRAREEVVLAGGHDLSVVRRRLPSGPVGAGGRRRK